MLRSCVCLPRSNSKRRSSSVEDSSSCRSSEIERVGASMEASTAARGRGSSSTGAGSGAAGGASSGGGAGSSSGGAGSGSGGGGGVSGGAASLLQFLYSKSWYRHWRKPGRGMSMTKVERTMKAALLIQRWYRRYLARMEIRRRYTWTIFQSLEYAGEQDQVELYNFFNALLTHIPDAMEARRQQAVLRKSSESECLDPAFFDELEYNEDGQLLANIANQGPQLKFPLNKKDVTTLIDLFRRKKDNRLHAKQVGAILREAAIYLQRLPNLNQASTAISKQITIIGDLHGKLDDLLVVFHKNGLPSTDNPYVFNGDFVDRGKKSLEILLLLLSCFLAFPGAVFLNRGNHEDSVMNARYGFIREVQQKYTRNSDRLLKLIDEVFRWLPLGTIINNRVLVVHGGISNTTNLDLIKSLDRGKYVSILRPPVETISGEGVDKVEWKQLFDILWSDPQHNEGCIPNTLRAAGTYFGPDISEAFLKKYKMKLLVRSHECKPDGYEFMHDRRVVTIFSASNYYAIGSNKGAYLKLNPQLEPHFVQYVSAASKTSKLTFRQKVGLIEGSAIRELGGRLRDRRNELEAEFRKHDPDGRGIISISKWCDSMEKATSLGLPWRLMRDKLAPMPDYAPPNEINYFSTLDLLDTDIIVAAQMAETSVAESLYENKSSLEAIFHILDKDNSGQITLDEFGDACDLLQRYLPGTNSREELLEMCKMMDINKDGFVDLNEFLEAFRLCDKSRRNVGSEPLAVAATSTISAAPSAGSAATTPAPAITTTSSTTSNTAKHSPRSPAHTSWGVAQVAATLTKRDSELECDIDPTDHESK